MWDSEIGAIYRSRKCVRFLDQIINIRLFVSIGSLHGITHQHEDQINDLKILKPRYRNTQIVVSHQKYHWLYETNFCIY